MSNKELKKLLYEFVVASIDDDDVRADQLFSKYIKAKSRAILEKDDMDAELADEDLGDEEMDPELDNEDIGDDLGDEDLDLDADEDLEGSDEEMDGDMEDDLEDEIPSDDEMEADLEDALDEDNEEVAKKVLAKVKNGKRGK